MLAVIMVPQAMLVTPGAQNFIASRRTPQVVDLR
jgi:hypothetical protein